MITEQIRHNIGLPHTSHFQNSVLHLSKDEFLRTEYSMYIKQRTIVAISISLHISLATSLPLISGPWNFVSWNIKLCLCSPIFSRISQKWSICIIHQRRRQGGCILLPSVGICGRKGVEFILGMSLSLVSWSTSLKSSLFKSWLCHSVCEKNAELLNINKKTNHQWEKTHKMWEITFARCDQRRLAK